MKKYFFRPHRGGLRESMEEHKFFDTIKEMLEYVVKDWNSWSSKPITSNDLTIKLYSKEHDARIGWNCTYIILLQGTGYAFFTDSYSEKWEDMYNDFMST